MRRRRSEPDPYWTALATYNAECSRGIVHTPEYDAEMAKRQAAFNQKMKPGVPHWTPTLPATNPGAAS